MKTSLLTLTLLFSLAASACTTVPTPSTGFLSRTDKLETAKGVRGKRLATPPPSPPVEKNMTLRIDAVRFIEGATVFPAITQAERDLIVNVLARNACRDFSRHFDIVNTGAPLPPSYHLRMGIARLDATNKLGAAVGVATSLALPISGLRPPIGLGSLTIEFELIDSSGQQAAAMVWSRKADVLATDAATSRIGDAYLFAEDATSDFEALASRQTQSGNAIRNPFRGKPDDACEVYGLGANIPARAVSALGLPLPPEAVDKGAKPPQ